MNTIAKIRASALVFIVTMAALATPLFAQTTGRIVGTIEDAQGAVLPGVTVTVTSPQLQGASTTVTDANGQFRFPSLPPGAYHVKAELAGFKSMDNDVRVNIDQTVTSR
jgi:Cna protein B-type domain.